MFQSYIIVLYETRGFAPKCRLNWDFFLMLALLGLYFLHIVDNETAYVALMP
jgi:hypothetical protein